ncbi:hypothetical protein BH10PSE17_BH10PSE17_10120 [soil metagenome]
MAVTSLSAAAVSGVSKDFIDPATITLGNLQSTAGQTSDNTPAQGDVRTVRLGISEVGNAVINGQLTDNLPAQIRLASPVNARASDNCGVATVFSGAPGGGSFQASGFQIPSGTNTAPGRCFVYFDVVSTTVGNFINQIDIGGFTGTEVGAGPVSNAEAVPRNLTVTALTPLSVAKSFAPSTILMGSASTLSITITNSNNGRSVDLAQLTEQLPANVDATGQPTIACTAGGSNGTVTASALSGTSTLSFAGTTVAGAGSCTITWPIVGRVATGTDIAGTNTIPANSVVNSRGLGSSIATASVMTQSPVTLSKNFSPTPARAGEPVTVTINVVNRSAAAVTAVGFDDNPISTPAGVTISTAATASAACGAATVTGGVGASRITLANATIAAGATCTVSAIVVGTGPQTYTDTITNGASWTQGPNSASTAPASAPLEIYSGLRAFKSILDPRTGAPITGGIAPGDVVRFRFQLENFSTGQITGVSITDNLPAAGGAQMTYATATVSGASNPTTTCTPSGNPVAAGPAGTPTTAQASGAPAVTFTGLVVPGNPSGDASAGTRCTLDLDAVVPRNWPAGTQLTNTVNAGDIGGASLQNTVSAGLPTVNQFQIAKAFSPTSIPAGSTSQLTITLINNSFNDLTGASVSDVLPTTPGRVLVANPAGLSTNCGGTPVYTVAADRGTVSVTGLTVPARLTGQASNRCVVQLLVTSGTPGNYTNTIPTTAAAATDARTGVAVAPPNPATANLSVTPSLDVTKTFSPSPVAATGGVSRVAIRLGNIGSAQLTGVAASDPLPASLRVATPANASSTCAGSPVVSASPGAAVVSIANATIPANTNCVFSFDVVTNNAPNPVTNTLPAGNVTADGGVATTTATSANLATFAGGSISLQKSFSPTDLSGLGQPTRMRLALANVSTQAVTNLGFADLFPAGLVIANTPGPVSTCAGAVFAATPGASRLDISGISIPAGNGSFPAPPAAACFVEVGVTVLKPGTLVNSIPAGAIHDDQGLTNTDGAVANVTALATVGVSKRFEPASVAPGQPSRLVVTVVNSSGGDFTNLRVVDPLPAGIAISTPANPTTTCSNGTVTTQPSSLGGGRTDLFMQGATLGGAPGSTTTCDITINVQSATAGAYNNTIANGGVTADGGVSNSAPADATLQVRSPVTLAKAFANPTRRINQADRLTITITNPNPIALTNVALTDTYPTGVFNDPAPTTATTCANASVTAAPSDTSVRITGATVPANGSCTFSVNVLANTPGAWNNTIAASSLTSTEGVTNATPASASFITLDPPVLGKQFVPVQIGSGGVSRLRIMLGNTNAAALTLSAALVDTLPGGLTLATPAIASAAAFPDPQGLPRCPGGVTAVAGNTTITYANGAAIPAGGCVIVANVTGSSSGQFTNVIPAGGLQTDAGPNAQPATATLAISPLASISGVVYRDAADNNVFDGADPGISGQTIELLNGSGTVIATTVTDSLGRYAFLELPAGNYSLRQPVQPPGTLNGATTAGTGASVAGSGTPATTATSTITGITLANGQNGSNYNFGEIVPVAVSGTVFLDANNNGVQDAGEAGIPNVPYQVTGTDDLGQAVSVTVTSDANGVVSAPALRPGIYTLTETVQPLGTANGRTTAGPTGGTATPVTTTPSAISTIDLRTPGRTAPGNLFAELPVTSAISGSIWLDLDNDGVIDAGEGRIANVTVELSGTDASGNAITRSIVTDANGDYSFTGLPPGTYSVREPNQPPGTVNGRTAAGTTGGNATSVTTAPRAITAITLGAGQLSTGNRFGALPGASIAGSVYNDGNNDGIRQGTETGFATQTLQLTGTDDLGRPVSVTTTTAADGTYRFGDLRPGTYTVTQPTAPPQTLSGQTTAGTINGVTVGTATAPTTVPSAISAIVLPIGGASINDNFGEIGDSPDVVATKQAVDTFATDNVGVYRITVANRGQLPTVGAYTIEDRLPPGMTLAAVPTGTGWTCVGAVGAASFTCSSSVVLATATSSANPITVRVTVAASLVANCNTGSVDNALLVSGGGELEAYGPMPTERTQFQSNPAALPVCAVAPAITQNVCRTPTSVVRAAAMGGTVWFDLGAVPRQLDGGDTRLAGWTVEILDADATGTPVVRTLVTAADGSWRADGLIPNHAYLVRFRDPQSGVVWGSPVSSEQGTPPAPCVPANTGNAQRSACVESDSTSQLREVLAPGEQRLQQSLPLDPGGVVYDAITREPVPGSVVTLRPVGTCPGWNPATQILGAGSGGYTLDGTGISMTVGAIGAYQFAFAPTAPASCRFALTVVPPAQYTFASSTIPAQSTGLTTPPGTGAVQVQPQAGAPQPGSATTWYLEFDGGSSRQAVTHNHIPLDPASPGGLVIVKTGSVREVELGDSLQYTILIRNATPVVRATVFVEDHLPAGFRLIAGTARISRGAGASQLAEPSGAPGPNLVFAAGPLGANAEMTLTYRVRVGVGSQQGDGINRAHARVSASGDCRAAPSSCSNESRWKVRVTGGVFTSEACVAGKIFVDCNGNQIQDPEELGIPGVRLYLQNGTYLISDSEGKYSYCGLDPKLHVLKVDPSTLPRGSRLVTSSNRNAGDAGSIFLDLKNGELNRADFIEGSCSNPVMEQVKARRTQGEVGGPENEQGKAGALRWSSKPAGSPQQGTDSANQQPAVHPRESDPTPAKTGGQR